ncbi:DUF1223 domain-containing protein [Maribacter sp. 2308TA10-17]|uniref:DUF1223 domain-containing protein n=1 Tax=Maribacter sp. 2308TA10-17 TaxID=3386276 RepID=UPI0039BD7566
MLKNIYITLILLVSIVITAFTGEFNKESIDSVREIEEDATYDPVVVLELFTSQGCSSCPSADLLLQKVKKEYEDEVFALSYHVDYWNYIGWRDPFSKATYADKQREYNLKFRNRSNYTPQLVINGKEHFVGSSSSKMYEKIKTYKEKKSANLVRLENIAVDKNSISFKYDIQGNSKNKIIRTLLVLDERTTQVKRGENRNRTLTNSNIVVVEKSFSLEDSNGSMKISIPEIVKDSEKLNLIVLVETEAYDITGATKHGFIK